MGRLRREDLLRAARARIVTTGMQDTAARLCTLNMQYGLAKILWLEQTLGLQPKGAFFGAPDATVTRNPNRWRAGFGYGGLVRWNPELVVLDAKPNGCGLLMGSVSQAIDLDTLKRRLDEVREDPGTLEGVRIQWDIESSNHFLSLCEPDRDLASISSGPVFLLHSSGAELRGPSAFGPGLYWDGSQALRRLARVRTTPFGPIRYLVGEDAQEYMRQVRAVHEFQMRRREHLAQKIFGDFRVLFHGMHQGLVGPGLMALGCYVFEAPGATGPLPVGHLVPVTLRPGEPVPVVEPAGTLSSAATRLQAPQDPGGPRDVLDFLTQVVLLPHGGGVSYPRALSLEVEEVRDRSRRFHIRFGPKDSVSFDHPRDLPFSYRGPEVVERTIRLGLARIRGRLSVRWWVGGAEK